MQIIHEIVLQHVENLGFNWLMRDSAVNEPHYSLEDLVKMDNRLEADIDGLHIAGNAGWEICKEELTWEEPGEVFTAAVLAFESGDKERVKAALNVALIDWELARGLVSALGWLPYKKAKPYIDAFLKQISPPMIRQIGIAASAIHRQDPGSVLKEAILAKDTALRVRALRAAGELGRRDLLTAIHQSFFHEDASVRFQAGWAAMLVGDAQGVNVLRKLGELVEENREAAIATAIRKMQPQAALSWLEQLKAKPETVRLAIIGTGAFGDPVNIPWLIKQMQYPELARVAGEAFTYITGMDLAYHDLEGEWPEGFETGPTEDAEDEDVDLDKDEDLPWPEPTLIHDWWQHNRGRFRNGNRYLLGHPITSESLQLVLREGMQRQRAAAALELALMHPGQALFEVRAPGKWQQRLLGLKR